MFYTFFRRNLMLTGVAALIIAALLILHYMPQKGMNVTFLTDPKGLGMRQTAIIDQNYDSHVIRKIMSVFKLNGWFGVWRRGYIYLHDEGRYTFVAENDDRVSLVIDNNHAGQSTPSGVTGKSVQELYLEEGLHRIILDSYRDKGRGWLRTWIVQPSGKRKPLYTADIYPFKIQRSTLYLKQILKCLVGILICLFLHMVFKKSWTKFTKAQDIPGHMVVMELLMFVIIGLSLFFNQYSLFIIFFFLLFWSILWFKTIYVRRRNMAGIVVGICIALAVYLILTTGIVSSNDGSHFALVQSMAEDHSFVVTPYLDYTQDIDASFVNGRYYSDRPPGTAVVLIPFYYAGTMLRNAIGPRILTQSYQPLQADQPAIYGCLLLSVISGILSIILMYMICRELGLNAPTARLTAMLLGFATMNIKYATVIFSHAFCQMLVLMLLYLCVVLTKQVNHGISSLKTCFIAGLVLGYLPLVEYVQALLYIPAGIYLVYMFLKIKGGERLKCIALIAAGMAAPLCFFAIYNYVCFGDVTTISYTFSRVKWVRNNQSFQGSFLEGLTGLLFSIKYKGVLIASPFLLFGILGVRSCFKSNKVFCVFLAGIFLVILLPVSRHLVYWGGGTRDPRYLYSVMPVLLIPVAFWREKLSKIKARTISQYLLICVFWILVFYSILYNFIQAIMFGRAPGVELVRNLFNPAVLAAENVTVSINTLFPHYRLLPVAFMAILVFVLWFLAVYRQSQNDNV